MGVEKVSKKDPRVIYERTRNLKTGKYFTKTRPNPEYKNLTLKEAKEREKAKEWLKNNPEIADKLEKIKKEVEEKRRKEARKLRIEKRNKKLNDKRLKNQQRKKQCELKKVGIRNPIKKNTIDKNVINSIHNFCIYCGNPLKNNQNFCTNCGKKI